MRVRARWRPLQPPLSNLPSPELAEGLYAIPPGRLAAVVTYLEMRSAPERTPRPMPEGVTLRRVDRPDPDWYLKLFRAVGEPWLWFGRLRVPREELVGILHHHLVEVHVAERGDQPVGLLELDFRETPDTELQYFGVTPDWVGHGLGGAMLDWAIERVWRSGSGVERFWLHTCSLDHPAALSFYQKAGFRPYKRCVEVCDDPRWTGEIPRKAALHVPLL